MRYLLNGIALTAVTAAIAIMATPGRAEAQIYPAPTGYCVISPSVVSPPLDSTVTLLITAADRAGNPLSGLSGSATVIAQPADDAQLTPNTFTTGSDGTASLLLHTGGTPGVVRVATQCGVVEVTTNLLVGEAPGPPPTGEGSGSDHRPDEALAVALVALAAAGAGLGIRWRHAHTRTS